MFLFSLKNSNVGFAGKISKILPKSFYFKELDTNGDWLDETTLYKKDTIRKINFDSDYLNSLLKYNKWKLENN